MWRNAHFDPSSGVDSLSVYPFWNQRTEHRVTIDIGGYQLWWYMHPCDGLPVDHCHWPLDHWYSVVWNLKPSCCPSLWLKPHHPFYSFSLGRTVFKPNWTVENGTSQEFGQTILCRTRVLWLLFWVSAAKMRWKLISDDREVVNNRLTSTRALWFWLPIYIGWVPGPRG